MDGLKMVVVAEIYCGGHMGACGGSALYTPRPARFARNDVVSGGRVDSPAEKGVL